jgi:molybdopterin synthase sulfur carrier subunit
MIRIDLPPHLRLLANIPTHEISLAINTPTLNAVIDALETTYPALRGTIRDHHTQQRRPFFRFFASEEDISQLHLNAPLPAPVADGIEPLLIIAGIAGG